MRVLMFLLLAGAVMAAESAAPPVAPSVAPPPRPTPLDETGVVSMAIKDASAMVVVETIAINGRYNFVAQGHFDQTVSVNLRDTTLRQAFDSVTGANGLEYRIVDGTCILYGRDADACYVETYTLPDGHVDEPGGLYEIAKAMVRPQTAESHLEFAVMAPQQQRVVVRTRPSVHRALEKLVEALHGVPEASERKR